MWKRCDIKEMICRQNFVIKLTSVTSFSIVKIQNEGKILQNILYWRIHGMLMCIKCVYLVTVVHWENKMFNHYVHNQT